MTSSKTGMRKLVFAGGGTAGHIEPALAVARVWKSHNLEDQIIFLGSKSGLENTLVPAAGFALNYIPKVSVPRKLSFSLLQLPITLLAAIIAARTALKGADLLIGFGGYVSAPAYLAAKSLDIPVVIHEANAKPGLANRLGAQFTEYVAVAQPIFKGKLKHALVTGLPLRPDVHQALIQSSSDWSAARSQAKAKLGFDQNSPLIVMFFGSQGSVALNSVIAKSLSGSILEKFQVYHAVGKANNLLDSHPNYRCVNYIEDMASAYLAADLIICRSGAVTCSEVNALGRYSLFIPLPIGNGEQQINARYIQAQGRGEILLQQDFDSNWLDQNVDRLMQFATAATPIGNIADLNASDKILSLMNLALAGGKRREISRDSDTNK